jgi:hypothetical protein
MQQSGELKAFLHSLDPPNADDSSETTNPLAGADQPKPQVWQLHFFHLDQSSF